MKKVRPNIVTYVKGTIYDFKTKQKLGAKIELLDLETGETAVLSSSDNTNGEFLVCLPAGKNYSLNVSKKGYLFHSEHFSLKGIHPGEPYSMDVPLQPIDVGNNIILKNIFFETNSYQLKNESKVELDKLIAFLVSNPTVKIEIGGHTDNIGEVSYNEKLSKNRAKAVYQYLIDNEIATNRLTYKGYGEDQSITSNDTEEGRAQNRRTEITIIEK